MRWIGWGFQWINLAQRSHEKASLRKKSWLYFQNTKIFRERCFLRLDSRQAGWLFPHPFPYPPPPLPFQLHDSTYSVRLAQRGKTALCLSGLRARVACCPALLSRVTWRGKGGGGGARKESPSFQASRRFVCAWRQGLFRVNSGILTRLRFTVLALNLSVISLDLVWSHLDFETSNW